MSDQYVNARYPITTIAPAQLSALDLGAAYEASRDFRVINWWGRPDEIKEQEVENDTAYLSYLQSARVEQFNITQPIIKWRVGRPASMKTTNDVAIAAADLPGGGSAGYIGLADSVIVGAGTLIHFVEYGVTVRVLDTDDDESEVWTNDAGSTCNVKCELLSGPAVAIPVGKEARIGSVVMGEQGTPGEGHTTAPGDPQWNTFQLVGIYGTITRVQMESEMIGAWGTHEKVRRDTYYQFLMGKQNDLLFGRRWFGTDSQATQGQLWLCNGIVPQIKSYVYNAGSRGLHMEGQKLNDFLEYTFDSELSSVEKDWFCGSAQFRDVRKAALQGEAITMESMPGLQSGATNPGTLGANSMVIRLQSGKKVTVHELRKAFDGALADWGVLVDAANVGYGSYKAIRELWFQDIETPAQRITKRTDAVVDTFSVCVKDESTMAVIRGGTRSLIQR